MSSGIRAAGRALRAEWTKLRTLPGTPWLVLAVIAVTAAVSAAAAAAVSCPVGGCPADPVKTSLTGVQAGQAVAAVVAVQAISGEYSTRMMTVTLTAMPHRLAVLAAKAAVAGGLVLAASVAGVGVSVLAGRLILPGHGFTVAHAYPALSLGDGPVLRAAAGSVLYLTLIALLSVGIGAALRDSAVAIGAVLGLLYLFPIIVGAVTDGAWKQHLRQIGPMTAGLDIQATANLRALPLSPWQGLGVLALWAHWAPCSSVPSSSISGTHEESGEKMTIRVCPMRVRP